MWKNVSAIDLTSIDTVLNVCNIIKVGSILKNTSCYKIKFYKQKSKKTYSILPYFIVTIFCLTQVLALNKHNDCICVVFLVFFPVSFCFS